MEALRDANKLLLAITKKKSTPKLTIQKFITVDTELKNLTIKSEESSESTTKQTTQPTVPQPIDTAPHPIVPQPTVTVPAVTKSHKIVTPQITVKQTSVKQPVIVKQHTVVAAKPPQVKESKPTISKGSFIPIAPKEAPVKLKHVAAPKLENTSDDVITLEKEEDRLMRIIKNRFGGISTSVLNAKKKR